MAKSDTDRNVSNWIIGIASVGLFATAVGLIIEAHWVALWLLIIIAGMLALQVYINALTERNPQTGRDSLTALPWPKLMKRYHRIGSVTRFTLFVGLGLVVTGIILAIGWAGGLQPHATGVRIAYNKFWLAEAFGLTPLLLAFLIGIFRLLLENRLGDPEKSEEVRKLLGWALWPKDAVSTEEAAGTRKIGRYSPFDLQFKPGRKGAIVWFLSFLALWMVDAVIEFVRSLTGGARNVGDPGTGWFAVEVIALHALVIGAAWTWIYLGLFRKLCDIHGLSGTLARRYLGLKSNAQLPFQVVVIGASESGKTSFIVRQPAGDVFDGTDQKVRGFSFPGASGEDQYQVVAIDPPGEFLGDHLYYAQQGRADCLVLVVRTKGLDAEDLESTSKKLSPVCGSPITAGDAEDVLDAFIKCWHRDEVPDPKYLRALKLALTRQEVAGATHRRVHSQSEEVRNDSDVTSSAQSIKDPSLDSLLAVEDRPKRFCLFLNLDKSSPRFPEESQSPEPKNEPGVDPRYNGLHRVAEAWGRLFGLQPEACRTIWGKVDNALLFERIYETEFTANPPPDAVPPLTTSSSDLTK
ncbi:MAG: hypothetical protein WAO00_09455 [Chthoniobacterales bacterium]